LKCPLAFFCLVHNFIGFTGEGIFSNGVDHYFLGPGSNKQEEDGKGECGFRHDLRVVWRQFIKTTGAVKKIDGTCFVKTREWD
jgi:hypothetical protein